jgi:hypothetical protein
MDPGKRRGLLEVAGAGTLLALTIFFYDCGERNGERNTEAKVLEAKNDLKSQLATKEQELRQCTNTNASLQAVLQLKDADRNRLLEITTVEPPLRITYGGKPLKGNLTLRSEHVQGPCAVPVLWMENTGTQDVRIAGGEAVTPTPFVTSNQVQPLDEGAGASTVFRHFIEFKDVVTPGGRRWTPVQICKNAPLRSGDQIPARLAIFAEGFLPLRETVQFLVP